MTKTGTLTKKEHEAFLDKYNTVYSKWCAIDNYFNDYHNNNYTFCVCSISVPYAGRRYSKSTMVLNVTYGIDNTVSFKRFRITPHRFVELYNLGAFGNNHWNGDVVAKYILGV